jgi:hypothetical protein
MYNEASLHSLTSDQQAAKDRHPWPGLNEDCEDTHARNRSGLVELRANRRANDHRCGICQAIRAAVATGAEVQRPVVMQSKLKNVSQARRAIWENQLAGRIARTE